MQRVALLAFSALVFAGCTLGLGEYAVGGVAPLGPDSAAGNGDGGDVDTARDGSARPDGADASGVTGGPCVSDTKQDCSTPDLDGGGTCQGSRQCIEGKYTSCVVQRLCPSQWGQNTAAECKNTDAIGDSPLPRWTESPTQGGPKTLWSVPARALPFDTYGRNDQFCFTPKQFGNCYSTSTVAVQVICAGNQKKLTNNDFENPHNDVTCIDRSGPTCNVIDKDHALWAPSGSATECVRWFEKVSYVVKAPPQCAAW